MKLSVILAAALALGGCATVTRGTTSNVTIQSEPSGAQARTSLGHNCPATPCTFEVSRKAEFIVSYSMDGYQDAQVPVTTRVAGSGAAGFAGNILVGGIIGMGVDAATGATYEHFPNPVMAELMPVSRVTDQRRRPQKPKATAPKPTESEQEPVS